MRILFILGVLALAGCPSRQPLTQPPNISQDTCDEWVCDATGDCWCDSMDEFGEDK